MGCGLCGLATTSPCDVWNLGCARGEGSDFPPGLARPTVSVRNLGEAAIADEPTLTSQQAALGRVSMVVCWCGLQQLYQTVDPIYCSSKSSYE